MDSYGIKSELDYLMHFLPMNDLINTVIPATNKGKKENARWTDMNLNEMLHFLGVLLATQYKKYMDLTACTGPTMTMIYLLCQDHS